MTLKVQVNNTVYISNKTQIDRHIETAATESKLSIAPFRPRCQMSSLCVVSLSLMV